ncbi:response regulator [Ideonella azotifigens]|uniref:Response regulator n=2 Tax=Ideonella azotifigens TaxID=513160 RepID=A0ABN1KM47_9BURK|nr:response regulator [Ideonella azotifigens]MCD2343431.1 response regulator [Ideonella azotifigens]
MYSSSRPAHLFVVEDDPELRDMLQLYFQRQGQQVTALGSAEELLARLRHEPSPRPDLVVLDVGLPGMSGLQACQRLRAEGDRLPIILLTASTEEVDRILGLEMGADDYLGKPFSARELLARIRAVLRRTDAGPPPASAPDRQMSIGAYRFSPAQRSLQRGDEVRVLNTVEYALLHTLTRHAGSTVSREQLLAASHSSQDAVLLRAIDAAIMRLRKLIEPDPAAPRFIQTVRGHGYMFVPHTGETLTAPEAPIPLQPA